MRFRSIKTLIVLCSVALTGGCGLLKQTTPAQPVVAPVAKVSHSASVIDPHYEMGRFYQSRRQYEAAIAAYRKSLQLNPGNAEAHNALGVIYASLGKHEQAVAEIMAALALAPSAAHIHNNLGYAYFLRGRNAEAAAALRIATELEPTNRRSRENMKTLEAALPPKAQPLDESMLARSGAMIESTMAEKRSGAPSLRLVSVAPNIFELRVPPSPPLKAALPSAPVKGIVVRLEVSNGNGITGLARRTSSSLQKRGYVVSRLTNQLPYKQQTTEIQYRPGEEDGATQLNALLSQPAKLVESSRLSPTVTVRLVLGHDTGHEMLFADTSTTRTALAGL